jgi:steroid delta-isomerase-like uncharacterized protein
MNKEKIQLVQRLFLAWNKSNIPDILDCYQYEFIREDIGKNKTYGQYHLEKTIKEYYTAFPDIHYEIEKLIEKDKNIVVCWRATGHHKGKLMGIPATGKQVQFNGISILEIVNNKIRKVWYMWDEAGMLRQMGMLTELRMESPSKGVQQNTIQNSQRA